MELARTALLGLGLGLGATHTAAAAPVYTETLVHDTTTEVEITLDDTTVLCSAADYGAEFLKILIPELAKLTLLDHQNTGAGAPCVASGLCEPGNEPSDILDASAPTETVAIRVTAVRADLSDVAAQTCDTHLIENVSVDIRGITFTHQRVAPLGPRPFTDCVSTQVAPEPEPEPEDDGTDDKTDRPYVTSPDGGGCSTAPQGTSLGMLALAGLFALRRRRR